MNERAHARWLAGDVTYPDEVAAQVAGHLDDVATCASRDALVDAMNAAYAAVGVHEDWLASDPALRRKRSSP